MFNSIEQYLLDVPALLVYLLVALVVGVESLGIPLPGEVVLVAAAVLSAHDDSPLSPHWVAFSVVLGATTGDSIGYGIGHRYGDRVFRRLSGKFPRHINDDVIAYAEHIFKKYGLVAVFVGRFIALLRIFAGPLAGMLKMHYQRFLVANLGGAICWGAGTTYAVYYLGRAAETYLQNFSYLGLAAALLGGVVFSTVLRKKLERNIAAFAQQRREARAAI